MNAVEQTTDSVAHAGRFAGEVVVEPDQNTKFGECVITGIDPSRRARQSPGGVGDDERVTRIGLGLPWIQICDSAHRQTRKVRDLVAAGAGDSGADSSMVAPLVEKTTRAGRARRTASPIAWAKAIWSASGPMGMWTKIPSAPV